MKKVLIILGIAYILSDFITAAKVGAMIGTGIGSAKAFAGFSEVLISIILYGGLAALVIFLLFAIFTGKKKTKNVRHLGHGRRHDSYR